MGTQICTLIASFKEKGACMPDELFSSTTMKLSEKMHLTMADCRGSSMLNIALNKDRRKNIIQNI